ncbi:hypothetical protein K443DRAFT_220687 [Laccaria amethystina LaAM-08-1]|uniref:Uncharacterized protein n=1 Tax=Laccaria amethystina LaAM-08-1 TaxID=1095629 RepID=A0A0C9XQ62_9AGAR|nr:hypothetical protein K443DRAFT_220687 [Laccaria amethystina LaAM-08-1]
MDKALGLASRVKLQTHFDGRQISESKGFFLQRGPISPRHPRKPQRSHDNHRCPPANSRLRSFPTQINGQMIFSR